MVPVPAGFVNAVVEQLHRRELLQTALPDTLLAVARGLALVNASAPAVLTLIVDRIARPSGAAAVSAAEAAGLLGAEHPCGPPPATNPPRPGDNTRVLAGGGRPLWRSTGYGAGGPPLPSPSG
jgi:hypothetical protein